MQIRKLITAALCITFTAFIGHASAQVTKTNTVKKKVPVSAAKVTPPPPFATAPEIEDGKNLVSKSDCLACHKTDDKLVGPAYIAIAAKYPKDQNTLNTLSQKVISGGSGAWGPVPMAPHPAITPADANKMVKYILTLDSKNPATASK
jgi:cytochrome c